MPIRKIKPYTNGIFHIFNKSINHELLFPQSKDYQRFLNGVRYYQQTNQPVKLSRYLYFCKKNRQPMKLDGELLVTIYAYCLMPTHFHFLLKQEKLGGINEFMHKLQSSYTQYLNSVYNRSGHLFQGRYGLVEINSDEALIHVSRYIHLNPSTAGIIEPNHLKEYRYSSYYEIVHPHIRSKIADTTIIIKNDVESYKQFVLDNADYQRQLAKIKKYVLE